MGKDFKKFRVCFFERVKMLGAIFFSVLRGARDNSCKNSRQDFFHQHKFSVIMVKGLVAALRQAQGPKHSPKPFLDGGFKKYIKARVF